MKLLYVDLFCGAGGTSTGVESAQLDNEQCARVVACVNHDKNAIASHMANHPEALHFTEDIRTLELSPLVTHLGKMRELFPDTFVVLWASLECTNFSKAKGGQPRDADSRTLAEHLFRYISALDPDYIQIENVEEFMSWGEMDESGKPISMDKGRLYCRWVNNVKRYGYRFDHRILNAADFGAYTSRKRFFGIFAKRGLPIVFPEATHAKEAQRTLFGSLAKWKPVKEVLDFTDEGLSIFGRSKPLSEKTLERVYAGGIKFVAGGKEAFLSRYNTVRPQDTCKSIDEPCGVLTTENRFAKVQCHFLSKYFSGHPESKNISIDGPAHTIKCKDNHALITSDFLAAYYGNGNNVRSVNMPCPAITTVPKQRLVFIDQQFGQSKPVGTDQPCGAITTNPKYALVNCRPWIMNTNFSNVGSDIDQPAQTITANRKWHYLMNPQFKSAGGSIDNPCFTLIARMDKMPPYLAECTMEPAKDIPSFIRVVGNMFIYEIYDTDSLMTVKIKEFMALYGILDIKMRMLKIPELKKIMGFPENYVLIGTQADQKKYIGNAVEVNMARVLCEALARKLHELQLSQATLVTQH
jgi:C-5 cytosine-specific DNA methylase